MRMRSRERLMKRGCFAFVWNILPPRMETRCWVLRDLKRKPDVPCVAQLLLHRLCEFTEQQAYLYCKSLSIKHIQTPNKPFGLSPILTIHSIALLQFNS